MAPESDPNPYESTSGGFSQSDQLKAADSGDLTVVDWLLCIFCGTIGCIVGIVRLIQGKSSGGKMIGFSILFTILWTIVRVMLRSIAQNN